jgi:hypothetical protein
MQMARNIRAGSGRVKRNSWLVSLAEKSVAGTDFDFVKFAIPKGR